jgi:hypothetical protein
LKENIYLFKFISSDRGISKDRKYYVSTTDVRYRPAIQNALMSVNKVRVSKETFMPYFQCYSDIRLEELKKTTRFSTKNADNSRI